jgi:diguanylate cyclase (GGDEF)-like protein
MRLGVRTIGAVTARAAVALALALFCARGVAAAPLSPWANLADPVFQRLDGNELPQSSVDALAQDRAGFIWIGTQGGLARYDGYHFQSFLPNPSDPKALPDGYILALLSDPAGGLWIGTQSSGLVRYDAATDTFRTWRASASGRSNPRNATIDALAADPGGGLLLGGNDGLERFDPKTATFTAIDLGRRAGLPPLIASILVDSARGVWVGSNRGLFYRAPGTTAFRHFDVGGRRVVQSLYQDREGRLWLGSDDALLMLDRSRHLAATFSSSPGDAATLAPGPQWGIAETAPGVVWAGTNSAISIVDVATHRVKRVAADRDNPGGLTPGQAVQFFRDASGLIWVANAGGGLLLHNPNNRGIYELSATRPGLGLGESGASFLAAAPGNRLWAGDGGLVALDPYAATSTRVALPKDADIETLAPSADGATWVGTGTGLCKVRLGEAAAECPAGPARVRHASLDAVLETGTTLWAGLGRSLLRIDTKSGRVTTYRHGTAPGSLSTGFINTLFRDREGRLWIGADNGLNRIDADGRHVARFTFDPANPNSIGPGSIQTIIEDRQGRIWAGAIGGPLDVLADADGGGARIRRLDRSDGLPHENVNGLAQDKAGRIWAGTDKGIALIDPVTLRARGLSFADGAPSVAYWGSSVAQSPDGTIFFGSEQGITAIAPDAALSWNYAPPLVVTALKLGRHNVPIWEANSGRTLRLPADSRDLTVEFAALDYSAPDALRYAYKLEGYDDGWIDADPLHRIATYTNLGPGRYTLRIRGTNRLGAWSDRSIALDVVALPAWFEQWWFRVLAALIVLGLIFAAFHMRTATLRKRQRELEAIVSDRTRALFDVNMELAESARQLEEMTLTDPLTGLRNRRFLVLNLHEDAALAIRRYDDWVAGAGGDPPEEADLVFFLIDLDRFKSINDKFGHNTGDQVLAQMRERLQSVFRESDYLARWGGEEFLVVARGSRRSEAREIAERVREAVAAKPFALDGERSIDLTASIGFAAFPFVPSSPRSLTWQQVVDLADRALYLAKHAGRNAWYGLTASERTDAEQLITHLTNAAEDVVRATDLHVVTRGG